MARRLESFLVGRENLRYIVLAERNSKNLREGIDSLWCAWSSLRRSVHWKRRVKGCVVVLEVTYNRESQTWHPHLNIIFEGDYFPFELLNKLWRRATAGNGRTTHIQAIKGATDKAVRELMKYTLKVAERAESESGEASLRLIVDRGAALDEFLSAIYGLRLVRTYGTFFALNMQDEGDPVEVCPDCGSTQVVDLGPVAHHQLLFDFEKEVFRIREGEKITVPKSIHLAHQGGQTQLFAIYTPSSGPMGQRRATAAAIESRRAARAHELFARIAIQVRAA